MGCLNSTGQFNHWFGNIHLSGPCNRNCYFCIGQHMMDLDANNNLDTFPLLGLGEFLEECDKHKITEINLTGTNTDPLLYKHLPELRQTLQQYTLGIRTNGVKIPDIPDIWPLFDKASISIPSLTPLVYNQMMGPGAIPDLYSILRMPGPKDLKINVVLGPENRLDLWNTLARLAGLGIRRVNLREPYGQPHIGCPFDRPDLHILGCPTIVYQGMIVTYWDVHYCEVESVNLYASGRVSVDYPITRGYSERGNVWGQDHFPIHGRHNPQWLSVRP